MTIEVLVDRGRTSIARSVFVSLLENSVVNQRVPFQDALVAGRIHFSELVELARRAEIPYSLFFAPQTVVDAQLATKTKKLLQGVSPTTFTVSSRSQVALRDVELIIKDLLRKQSLLKQQDKSLTRNTLVGLLKKSLGSIEQEANAVLAALELDRSEIRQASTGEAALERIIARLERKQVLVSRSVRGFMPQLIEVHFSGMTVRDPKVPYIFLAGGDHLDAQEPVGRQIFTLVLMAVLVARGVFAPVTYDAQSTAPGAQREYDIVGEILMPLAELRGIDFSSLAAVKEAAREFKVTPSAVTVRGLRAGRLSQDMASVHLTALETEFRQRPKSNARTPKPVNAVRKYCGNELSLRLLAAVDAGTLSAREFCRVAALNHLKPAQLREFREALR